MKRELQRYLGRMVEIIYIDRHSVITRRYIEVWSVNDLYVKAFCCKQKRPRIFRIDSILAAVPVSRRTG